MRANATSPLVLGPSKAFEAGTGISRAEENRTPRGGRPLRAPCRTRLASWPPMWAIPVVMVTEEVTAVPSDVWAALESYAAAGGALLLARPPRDVPQRLPLLPGAPRDAWNAYGFGQVYLCQSGVAGLRQGGAPVVGTAEPPLDPVGPPPRWENNRYALTRGRARRCCPTPWCRWAASSSSSSCSRWWWGRVA